MVPAAFVTKTLHSSSTTCRLQNHALSKAHGLPRQSQLGTAGVALGRIPAASASAWGSPLAQPPMGCHTAPCSVFLCSPSLVHDPEVRWAHATRLGAWLYQEGRWGRSWMQPGSLDPWAFSCSTRMPRCHCWLLFMRRMRTELPAHWIAQWEVWGWLPATPSIIIAATTAAARMPCLLASGIRPAPLHGGLLDDVI